MPLQNPDDEFVWNGWFSLPFKNIGLPQHCVTLLQGFAECRNFGSLDQLEGIVALTARHSRPHPGTRYLARDLNSCFSTGNEVECEQLVWIAKRAGQSVPFNTYIWRRGTIPMPGNKQIRGHAASIPQCVNGTNLIIPLPGPISAEDMAITGAGARLHAQDTSSISLLYDFEELEGELDYLTHVVALTFYPAVSGDPVTLGEIEILGVSLPWKGIFTNEGPGARLIELAKKSQKETNPFMSTSESNPFLGILKNENVTPSVQPSASTDLWADLLTGEDPFLEPLWAIGNVDNEGSDLLDFLDQSVVEFRCSK